MSVILPEKKKIRVDTCVNSRFFEVFVGVKLTGKILCMTDLLIGGHFILEFLKYLNKTTMGIIYDRNFNSKLAFLFWCGTGLISPRGSLGEGPLYVNLTNAWPRKPKH